jgi:hypothetical protein
VSPSFRAVSGRLVYRSVYGCGARPAEDLALGAESARPAVLQATTVLATALSLSAHDATALIAETPLIPRISLAEREAI